MKKLLLVVLLTGLSSCFTVQKTKIGSLNFNLAQSPDRNSLRPLLPITLSSIDSFVYTDETLDLSLFNSSNQSKINFRLDNSRSKNDTLFFTGETISREHQKRFLKFYLTRSQLKQMVIKSTSHEQNVFDLSCLKNDAGVAGAKGPVDSLYYKLSTKSGFKINILQWREFGNGEYETYDGVIVDENNIRAEFHGTTDPIFFIVIGVVAAAGLITSGALWGAKYLGPPAAVPVPVAAANCGINCKPITELNSMTAGCECTNRARGTR